MANMADTASTTNMASASNTASTVDVPTELSVSELMKRLGDLGLPTTGGRAVLRERLRKALKPKENESTKEAPGIPGSENAPMADSNDLTKLPKEVLKSRLREFGLQVSGTKAVLRERLRAAMQQGEDDEDDTSDEEDDVEEDASGGYGRNIGGTRDDVVDGARGGVANVTRGTIDGGARLVTSVRDLRMSRVNENTAFNDGRSTRTETHGKSGMVLTFKDVEDALMLFSGDGTQSVRRWFALFEETAELCSWTDAQKVIYAKRLLRESAKLFANFECHARSYHDLKEALIEEFDKTLNSRHIHKELSAVTKKMDETFQEYIYRVLELASHAEIETEAKIQYIIDGVKDEEVNKSILYNATTIKELRQRFIQYETQWTNRNKLKHRPQMMSKDKTAGRDKTAMATSNLRKCFNCGDTKHLGKECPQIKGIEVLFLRRVRTYCGKVSEGVGVTKGGRYDEEG